MSQVRARLLLRKAMLHMDLSKKSQKWGKPR